MKPVLKNQSFTFKLATTVLLLVAASYAGVNVSSPTNGSTVGSPVHVVASSTSSNPIIAMKVYVDSNIAYSISGASIDTYLTLASGTRSITVQSWDSAGLVQKNSLTVSVSGTTTTVSSDTSSTSSTSVVVNSPTGGSTVGSPTTVTATGGSSINSMQIYVDGSLKYQVGGNSVNTSLSLAAGSHALIAQGWDSSGHYYKSAGTSFTVGSGSTSTGTTTTSGAPKFPDIQAMTGWQNCGACAGAGGTGPTVPYSMTQWITNPTMDGKTAQFWIGGTTRYAQALWWKQLGANSGAYNFVYDVYFYLKDANAPQALEFDVNQSVGGYKYIFGTECNLKQTGTWRLWDSKNSYWVNSGIACPKPLTYAWNHLTWEFKRVGNQTLFVAVTLNGVKTYANKYFNALPVNANEINVAFQMDENSYPTNYSTWLDKVSLNYW